MIARLKGKRANDVYIVGTFAWAMKQLKNGMPIRRRGWIEGASWVLGNKLFRPTALDKRSIDWEVVVLPTPIDLPDVYSEEPEEGASPFIALLALIMFVVLMVGAALYAHGSYKFPLF